MNYLIDDIASTLKAAREHKGLSQRALSVKSGVPQGHISKIENGAVDLRVSSLIALARVLDMELTLVPRKTVPAVQSIVRSNEKTGEESMRASREATNEVTRLQSMVADRLQLYPGSKELAQLQRNLRELQNFRLSPQALKSFQSAKKAMKGFTDSTESVKALRKALIDIQETRNKLVHGLVNKPLTELPRPAYSLDEEDDG
jgi:transcriptional regulator with XRE-family HTH domain